LEVNTYVCHGNYSKLGLILTFEVIICGCFMFKFQV